MRPARAPRDVERQLRAPAGRACGNHARSCRCCPARRPLACAVFLSAGGARAGRGAGVSVRSACGSPCGLPTKWRESRHENEGDRSVSFYRWCVRETRDHVTKFNHDLFTITTKTPYSSGAVRHQICRLDKALTSRAISEHIHDGTRGNTAA